MKNIITLILIINCLGIYAKEIPSDSLIIKNIFGKTDNGGKSFSRPFNEAKNEGICTYEDCIVWKIVFKDKVKLQNQDLIFSIIEAKDLTQHGHQFGYRSMYFFKQIDNKLILKDSIISDGEILLGDNKGYEIVDIGKDKKALVILFGSSGNQHFEGSDDIYLLEIGKSTFLISTSRYSKMTDSGEYGCKIIRYDEEYEIIKSDKEWYDIKINHIDFGYKNGCEEEYIEKKIERLYSFQNGKYIEKKNN